MSSKLVTSTVLFFFKGTISDCSWDRCRCGAELSSGDVKTAVDGLWECPYFLSIVCSFVAPRFLCVFIPWICENVVFGIFSCCTDQYQQMYSAALLLQAGLSTDAQCLLLIPSHGQGATPAAWVGRTACKML